MTRTLLVVVAAAAFLLIANSAGRAQDAGDLDSSSERPIISGVTPSTASPWSTIIWW
jgi:hypothetical protein